MNENTKVIENVKLKILKLKFWNFWRQDLFVVYRL